MSTRSRLRDRYVLQEVIGRGGMGVVHRAIDERLAREVAVKILPTADGDLGDRLRQEAVVLARLDHPALVRIFDADEHDGQPFLVMDLVEGETLKDRLAEGPLDEPAVRAITLDVVAGLAHAHGAGVVHRDLKPANLVLADDGRVRVVDFGIARLADATGLTKPGTAVGTAAYLAPEQLRGDAAVGPPADLYTLGLVLLECLTGERPFHGPALETAFARLERDPDIPDDLPAPWPALLRRMTALAPEARPTAEEVEEILTTGWEPAADDAGDRTEVATAAVAVAQPTASFPATHRPVDLARNRHLALFALATVAAVVLLALAIVLFARDGGSGRADPPEDRSGPPPEVPVEVREALDQLRSAIEP